MAEYLSISLAYSPNTRHCVVFELEPPTGSTIADALHQVINAPQCPDFLRQAIDGALNNSPTEMNAYSQSKTLSIDGHPCSLATVLRQHQRIDLLRPLRIDPKVARRERFQKQGARSAGLFAKRRPGAKPGY